MMTENEVIDERETLYGRVQDRGSTPVTDQGYPVKAVAERLGVTTHSLYAWMKRFGPKHTKDQEFVEAQRELRRLEAELGRVTEEREILKKAATYFAKESG